MANYNAQSPYGQGQPNAGRDPRYTLSGAQRPPSSYRAAVAPSPYQQNGPAYGNAPVTPQQYGLGTASQNSPGGGYFPGQAQDMNGLTAQMGGMGITPGQASIPQRKKDRHAHHDIAPAAGAASPMNAAPSMSTPGTQDGSFRPGSGYMQILTR